ncbi:MAG: hypothetical protein ACRDT4_03685 [Micromonosporaceae bacterium]
MTTHIESARTAAGTDALLRLVLRVDGVASGLSGVGALAGVGFLPGLLGTPPSLLVPAGVFLLVWAAALGYLSTRTRMAPVAVWVVIGANLLWVADSVLTAFAGWFPLTGLGVGYLLLQAAAVLVFAELQYVGLRRTR